MTSLAATPAPAADDRQGSLQLAAAGLLLGTLGWFLAQAQAHPLTAVWYRCAFGLLALSAWLLATGRLAELRLAPRALAAAIGAGALMVASWALFFAAIGHASIGLATVVVHVQPFWVMALGALLLGERVAPRQWGGAGLALAGLALASGLHGADAGGADATGVLLALASSLLYAGVALLARRAGGASPLALAWWQCAVGSVALAAWPLAQGGLGSVPGWGWLAAIGVLHTGLAYVLWYGGVARLGSGRGALLQFVYPATAVAVDALAFGRALDGLQWVGVGLMLAGLSAARH